MTVTKLKTVIAMHLVTLLCTIKSNLDVQKTDPKCLDLGEGPLWTVSVSSRLVFCIDQFGEFYVDQL
jgi:hypothetical protein